MVLAIILYPVLLILAAIIIIFSLGMVWAVIEKLLKFLGLLDYVENVWDKLNEFMGIDPLR